MTAGALLAGPCLMTQDDTWYEAAEVFLFPTFQVGLF
jgi:hypothetical protein